MTQQLEETKGNFMVSHWTQFEGIINSINNAEDPSTTLTSFMIILLSKVKLNVEEMSDAVQNGFLAYESFSDTEKKNLAKEFDTYLASIKN